MADRKGDVVVSIRNSGLEKARVLDANGMVVADVPLQNSAAGKTFTFPAEALYVVLQ